MSADTLKMMGDELSEVQAGVNEVDEFAITPEMEAAIRDIFNQFDKDKSSTIERTELEHLCIALNDPLSPADLADFFKRLDDDKNGRISFDEFIGYWKEG